MGKGELLTLLCACVLCKGPAPGSRAANKKAKAEAATEEASAQEAAANVAAQQSAAAQAQAVAPPFPAIPTPEVPTQPTEPEWPHTSDGQLASLHKIEYQPMIRNVDTYGGIDMQLLDRALEPAIAGHGRRAILPGELGTVDIVELILGLRSRLSVEVSTALNTLQVLSTRTQEGRGTGLVLQPCEDLLDELLSLVEELIFGQADHGLQDQLEAPAGALMEVPTNGSQLPPSPPLEGGERTTTHVPTTSEEQVSDHSTPPELKSHLTLVRESKATELDTRPFRRLPSPPVSSNGKKGSWGVLNHAERQAEQDATTALTVLNILRNCAQFGPNVPYCNAQPRLWPLLVRIAQVVDYFGPVDFVGARTESDVTEEGERIGALPGRYTGGLVGKPLRSSPNGTRIPLTYGEALRMRKDVLVIATCLVGEHTDLSSLPIPTVQGLWELYTSFLSDLESEAEIEDRLYDERGSFPKMLYYVDVALEGLGHLTLPDSNRAVLSRAVTDESLYTLGRNLLHRLPLQITEFNYLSTPTRLVHMERHANLLYNLAYLAPPRIKDRWITYPTPHILLQAIHRLAKRSNHFVSNPYATLAVRLCATLKLLCDGQDLVAQDQQDDGSLPFAGPDDAPVRQRGRCPPLIDQVGLVMDILLVSDLDRDMVQELQSLI